MKLQMKRWRILLGTFCLIAGFISAPLQANDLTVYLVRHAEKDVTQKTDPPLTEAGQKRAQRWAEVFKHTPISAVYSTDTRRTRETALPLASSQNLEITLYSVGSLEASSLMEQFPGGVVFVVGHSNTVPGLVNKLIGQSNYQDLDESEYDDLFRVSLFESANSGQAERLQLPLD